MTFAPIQTALNRGASCCRTILGDIAVTFGKSSIIQRSCRMNVNVLRIDNATFGFGDSANAHEATRQLPPSSGMHSC